MSRYESPVALEQPEARDSVQCDVSATPPTTTRHLHLPRLSLIIMADLAPPEVHTEDPGAHELG